MEFVLVPAGEFVVSSVRAREIIMRSCGRIEYHEDKDLRGRLRITQPFYLGKYEVTQAQWQQVAGSAPWSGREFVKTNARHAASCVSWEDCNKFLRKLRLATSFEGFCFPTVAQWEYACRAGRRPAPAPENNDKLKRRAWYKENAYAARRKYAHPIGQKKPNPWGLYDMDGNVWEWCAEWYDYEYFSTGPRSDPHGPTRTPCVSRGGSWGSPVDLARPLGSSSVAPSEAHGSTGLRVLVEMLNSK